MTTSTKVLIDRLTKISRVETDLYYLTAQRLRELDKPDCVWTFDSDQGMYDTGCGEAWVFSEGLTLTENKVKFCPFCQGAVKESK